MIKVTIENTDDQGMVTGEKQEMYLKFNPELGFGEAVRHLTQRMTRNKASWTPPDTDPILGPIQLEYVGMCVIQQIDDQDSKEARDLRRELYRKYMQRVRSAGFDGSYCERSNFYGALTRLSRRTPHIIRYIPTEAKING